MKQQRIWLLFASFLFFLCFISIPQSTSAAFKGTVTAETLNVRNTASLNGEIIGKLYKNNQVNIIKEMGDWLEIEYQSKKAYVNKQYVRYSAASTSNQQQTKIYVNGKEMALPIEPVFQNSRILVPFRVLGEALGIKVEWNNTTRQVIATDRGLEVIFTIDKEATMVNGKTINVTPAPMIKNNYTLIPLRYFSETFGAEVEWDEKSRKVTINRAIQIEEKPVDPKPVDPNPVEPKPVEPKPVQPKPVEQKPVEPKPVQPKPVEQKPIDTIPDVNQGTNLVGIVIPDVLNVRNAPSINGEKIGQLTKGMQIQILQDHGEWVEFSYKKQQAFVNKNYLVLRDGSIAPTQPIESLRGKTIVLDPGHGGKDPGAVNKNLDLQEKDIVLRVGLILEQKLREAGANVVMTRYDDRFLELKEITEIANKYNPDAFISIHTNAAENTNANGTETYWNRTYSSNESKQLADSVQKQMVLQLGTYNRGVKEANFYVIRYTKSPSVLVELGFITNDEEAMRLNSVEFQELAAEAILQGLVDYFSK